MKKLLLTLLALVGISQAQNVIQAGRTQWGDSLRWGDTNDSTGYLRARGNAVSRDSSGTWLTITTDSCSLPVRLGVTTSPNSKLELSYEVRTSSGNTDSSQVKIAFDSRYCRGLDTNRCESWVPAGRFISDPTSQIVDTLTTIATSSGTTWKPTRQIFDLPGGNQIRACVDGYKAGGQAGDSTFFRRFVIRNSSMPAGGTPPSSSTLTGDITVSDVAITSSALPAGAATSAKQPALGTAGTPSTDVITVQGSGAGTALPVSIASVPSHAVTNAGTFAVQAAQSGTWTVQPGNTANTTAWKVDASSAAVPVTDNSGSLTVDYATTGSGTATGALRVELPTNGTGTLATVGAVTSITNALPAGTNAIGKLAANSGIDIGDVDVTSVTPGTGATSLGKAEDATHTSADVGVAVWSVRSDADASLVSGTGEYAPLQTDANGYLKVNIKAGAGSGGTSATDDAAFTVASSSGTPVMGLADETSPDAVDEGDVGAVRMTLNRAIHVNLRDASGNELGAGAQYAEDTIHTSGDRGTQILAVRNDTRGTLAGASGDYAPPQLNSSGDMRVDGSAVTQPVSGTVTANAGTGTFAISAASLPLPSTAATSTKQSDGTQKTQIVDGSGNVIASTSNNLNVQCANCSGSGVSTADAASFTASTSLFAGTGGFFQTTATSNALTNGQQGMLQLTANRAAFTNLRNASGTEIATSGAPLRTDPTGTTTQPVSYATTGSGNATGALRVELPTNGTGVLATVGAVTSITNAVTVAGAAAHDAAISGNPVRTGGRGQSADYTAVTTGDIADLLVTLLGKQVVMPYALPGLFWRYAGAAGGLVTTTGVTAKAAAGAGIRNYVTGVQCINSHQTTSTEFEIRDGAAGTVMWRGFAQAAGGGFATPFPTPLRGTANTLVEIAEVTTTGTAGLVCNLQGFEAAE